MFVAVDHDLLPREHPQECAERDVARPMFVEIHTRDRRSCCTQVEQRTPNRSAGRIPHAHLLAKCRRGGEARHRVHLRKRPVLEAGEAVQQLELPRIRIVHFARIVDDVRTREHQGFDAPDGTLPVQQPREANPQQGSP